MALGRLKVWSLGELVTFTDINAEFDNLIAAVLAVSSTSADSITPELLTDGANPQVYFAELFADEAVIGTGLGVISSSALTITVGSGTAYILQTSSTPDKLVRVVKASTTVVTVPDNTTGFIDLGADGVFDTSTTVNAAVDHTRLISFTTLAGAITVGPTDVADRQFLNNIKFPSQHTGIVITTNAVTTGTIEAGAVLRDSTNEINITVASNLTFDITASGAGGLDQGSEASSTWYAVLVIADTTGVLAPNALLVSAANYPSSIVLPTGFDIRRRVGWVRNNSSSDFLLGQQVAGLLRRGDDSDSREEWLRTASIPRRHPHVLVVPDALSSLEEPRLRVVLR